MKMRSERLSVLRSLLSLSELSSQSELLCALRMEGFDITQATLSRDLKRLKVAKVATSQGKYVYALPTESAYKYVSPSAASSVPSIEGALSITFAGNLGVVKTRPGHASSVAYTLDSLALPQVLGTIAGDDTVFIAFEEGVDYDKVRALLGHGDD